MKPIMLANLMQVRIFFSLKKIFSHCISMTVKVYVKKGNRTRRIATRKDRYKKYYKSAKSDYKKLMTKYPSLTERATIPFLPISKWCYNMPYHEVVTLTTNVSPEVATTLVWTMNGLFDPEVPVGGHQPMGFDQAMAFYEHYTCVANEVTVTFCSGAANNDAIACGFYLSSSATPVTVSDQIVENGLLYRKILTSNVNNSKDIQTISAKINLTKFFGKKIINEDDYRGNAAALPTEQAYMIFFVNNLSGTNTNPVIMDITTNYTVKFTEPKKIPQS